MAHDLKVKWTSVMCTVHLLLKSFLCLSVLLTRVVEKTEALSPDGVALLQFKSNLSDPLRLLSNWKGSDATPCSWNGVTCGQDALSVIALDLSNLSDLSDLSDLPDEFGDWPLQGPLSSSLGSLANLSYLDLTNIGLAGPIPREMSNARKLSVLWLASNELNGSIPANFSQLRSLTMLDLSNNSLSGSIPPLDGLTNLTELALDNNNLSGELPTTLESLTSLTFLSLGPGNNFTPGQAPPHLVDLMEMTELQLPGLQLEGPLPSWIANMTKLERLDMSLNQLSGQLPNDSRFWDNMASLANLDLSGNLLNGSIPRYLIWDELIALNLSGNSLTGPIPDIWAQVIDLGNNQLDGPIPGHHDLRKLRLQNNRLSGDITSIWEPFPDSTLLLSDLQLQDNIDLRGELGEVECERWKSMEILDLSGTSINLVDNSLSIMLDTYSELQELRLSNIGNSGEFPATLTSGRSVLNLQVLNLSHSNLSGGLSLLVDINFTSLQVLDLSGNRLTGKIPPHLFAALPNLVDLNLSNNLLHGEIPPQIFRRFDATSFDGNPKLCGAPLKKCKPSLRTALLLAAFIACFLVSVGSCLLLAWRWRLYSSKRQQDAELIAALQGKESANLMPLKELRRATHGFSATCQIGVGGFGTVYKGTLNDGTVVAIKLSNRQASQQDKDWFLNEVKILSHLNHRNLVRLIGCCLVNKSALLVLEFVANGNLEEHLRGKISNSGVPPLTWTHRLRIALQTADAIAYLHCAANPPIFHRDIKSTNILLDKDMNVKVADFGISKLAALDETHVSTMAVQGTFGYMDPQYFTTFRFSAKSDVYSFGVVLLELISARAPIDRQRAVEEANLAIVSVPLIKSKNMQEIIDPAILETFNSTVGNESILGVGSLAVRCLELRSEDRPTMKEVSTELHTLCMQFDATLDISDQFPGSEVSSSVGDTPEHRNHTSSCVLTNSSSFLSPGNSSIQTL